MGESNREKSPGVSQGRCRQPTEVPWVGGDHHEGR